MSKVELKVGDVFTLTKSSSLYYRILELDKASNYAKIELICPYDVDNWDEFCSIVIEEYSITRDWFTVEDVKNWKKITSHQFKDIYLAVMKDIRDPDLDDKESNWLTVYKSIMNSINS